MEYNFRTEFLPQIRAALEATTQLRELLGSVASFELVIDTNILVADVIWLVGKRKQPDIKPALLECIIAGTICGYITPKVVEEVERVLPEAALEWRVSVDACLDEWYAYKKLINIRNGDPKLLAKYVSGVDPDDAPTLALAETIRACGIVSKDRHIKMMGGTAIPVEFVYAVRGYSRKACVSLTIKMCGYTLVIGTVAAAQIAAVLLRQATAGFMRLSDGVKLLLLGGLVLTLMHAKSRAAVAAWLQTAFRTLGEISPPVFNGMMELAELAIANQATTPELPMAS